MPNSFTGPLADACRSGSTRHIICPQSFRASFARGRL